MILHSAIVFIRVLPEVVCTDLMHERIRIVCTYLHNICNGLSYIKAKFSNTIIVGGASVAKDVIKFIAKLITANIYLHQVG